MHITYTHIINELMGTPIEKEFASEVRNLYTTETT